MIEDKRVVLRLTPSEAEWIAAGLTLAHAKAIDLIGPYDNSEAAIQSNLVAENERGHRKRSFEPSRMNEFMALSPQQISTQYQRK